MRLGFRSDLRQRPDPTPLAGWPARCSGAVVSSADQIDSKVDWVAKSLEGLRPVLAGGFYVHGGHDTAPAPAGATPIHIEAAQAFGTGHHETTAGCLEAIDRLARQRRFRRVIDVGTGTGVLAIAIAKRMRVDVLATDIDPVAVRTAAENARGNGVGSAVTAVEADGLHHPRIKAGAPYELIVANILAGPLVSLAPAMGRIAERGAAIVLSGLLTSQAPRVQAAYARQGMFLVERFPRGEWSTLVLEKR